MAILPGMSFLRSIWSVLTATVVFSAVAYGIYWSFTDERSPVPSHWNPLEPLVITDPPTMLTGYKLERALNDPETCLATLGQAAVFQALEPLEDSPKCGIANRVELKSVSGVRLRPIETSCQTALRLAMWAEHGLKPAAEAHFGSDVAAIAHSGSYNCRTIRGSSERMSTHATASSIDISGVTLSGGQSISLLDGWGGAEPRPEFFKELRDHGCDWFQTVLGPEFNRLHADHFHFQSRGWGTCR